VSTPFKDDFAKLTCKGRMGEGPRRLLIILSIPFFLCWFLPGIIFWYLVRLCLWILDGYRQDKNGSDAAASKHE
jgi:hypothetical protein